MAKQMINGKEVTISMKKYDPSKRDKWGRVTTNPYQALRDGKPYMLVPEGFVTLPKKNAFIVLRKHMDLGNGNQATYVFGYSNLKGKTQSGHVRRHYFAGRLFNMGGGPKVILYRASSYDQNEVRAIFDSIPYNMGAEYLDKNGQWHSYSKKVLTSEEVVARRVRRQENLERMKTIAYGSKEQRRQWAENQRRG